MNLNPIKHSIKDLMKPNILMHSQANLKAN